MRSTYTTIGVQPHRPRNRPYIGDSDNDVLTFITQFAKQIQDTPGGAEAYGLTADDLMDIIAARDRYHIALAMAQSPGSNSRAAVVAKNTARDEADRICRMYVQIIKNLPTVSDDLKMRAGVPVRGAGAKVGNRRRNGPPRTFPRLYIVRDGVPGFGSSVKLSFCDDALCSGRMPREDGVTHLVVLAQIAPLGASYQYHTPLMQIVAHATRNPFTVRFDASLLARYGLRPMRANEGDPEFQSLEVTFRGQWLNGKGDVGPIGPGAVIFVPMRGTWAMNERLKLAA